MNLMVVVNTRARVVSMTHPVELLESIGENRKAENRKEN